SRTTESIHLCETGDARFHQASEIIRGDHESKAHAIGDHMWPWSDDAHCTHEHIEHLWKLIDVKPAENSSHLRDSRIIQYRRTLICIWINNHSAEFQAMEDSSFQPYTFLLEEDRPGRIKFYENSNEGNEPGEQSGNAKEGDQQIDCPLDRQILPPRGNEAGDNCVFRKESSIRLLQNRRYIQFGLLQWNSIYTVFQIGKRSKPVAYSANYDARSIQKHKPSEPGRTLPDSSHPRLFLIV